MFNAFLKMIFIEYGTHFDASTIVRPLGGVRLDPYILIPVLQVINLAAICTPADYNTRPLDTIYSNFVDALPVVQYCRENSKRLIHFSTCEVYGKTIGSFLPKDSPLKKVGHCQCNLCNLSMRIQIRGYQDRQL
jgi:hypothetical protein